MKSRHTFWHPATLFLALTCLVVLLSWILEVYGVQAVCADTGEVFRLRSLLSPEGIRWMLRHVVSNFMEFPPLGLVLMIVTGMGMLIHSGLGDACLRRWPLLGRWMGRCTSAVSVRALSHKERRALQSACVAGGVYVGILLFATFSPWGILRSVSGGLIRSPFMEGLPFLFALGCTLMGAFYGCIVGRYRRDTDVVEGLVFLARPLMFGLLVAFFASQMFACMDYSRLSACLGIWLSWMGARWLQCAADILPYVPFVLAGWHYFRFSRP